MQGMLTVNASPPNSAQKADCSLKRRALMAEMHRINSVFSPGVARGVACSVPIVFSKAPNLVRLKKSYSTLGGDTEL